MKKTGKFLYTLMTRFEEAVSMSMITVTVTITVINVFARYMFLSSIPWAQEVVGIAWSWTCMLGISWCYRRNAHMGVDFVVAKLKPSMRRVVYILSFAILLAAFVFMTYMSIIITIKGGYKLTNYFKIPYSVKYISAVIAFFNMSVYSLCFVYLAARRPDEFLKRVSLNGNGLDELDPEEEIDGMEATDE